MVTMCLSTSPVEEPREHGVSEEPSSQELTGKSGVYTYACLHGQPLAEYPKLETQIDMHILGSTSPALLPHSSSAGKTKCKVSEKASM